MNYTEDKTVLDAGTALADPSYVTDPGRGNGVFATIPDGYRIEDLERYCPRPIRARDTILCETPEAFVSYYNRFKCEDVSMAFSSTNAFLVKGIIDWHSVDGPGFGDHTVVYSAPRSQEWDVWMGKNEEPMSQADFSQFVEDNVKDIRVPAGADVLEVARQLEVKKSVEFASALRLSDGQREFTYNEEVNGTTHRGQMKVPEEFKLGIPVFLGGDHYEVTARLRYRIDHGKLRIWYNLLNPHLIEQDAFSGVVGKIAEGIGAEVLMGMPA